MKRNSSPVVCPARDGQRGQSLVLLALVLVALLSSSALVIDLGVVYYSFQELSAATNAAALAGGGAVPQGTGTNVAYLYSGWPSAPIQGTIQNVHANLNITGVTTSFACVAPSSYPNLGLPPCATYSAGQGNINVIQVTERATVPTLFAKVFGVTSVPIVATATASAKGGTIPPFHIVMVLDSTPSMQQAGPIDKNCIPNNPNLFLTPMQCAEQGIQTLLNYLSPCPTTFAQCTFNNGVATNAVDQVALMTFPGLTPSQTSSYTNPPVPAPTAHNTYSCPPTGPSITNYNNNPGYLILPFQSDYRASASAASLLSTSNLVRSVGATTQGNCSGIHAANQSGTFYAGVLDSAQAYLAANTTTGVKNIIILLSDGDASDTSSMGGTAGGPHGLYPSKNECAQAITEANAAKNAGTVIYSVSYGSELTGCNTDTPKITPCQTMEQISSSPTGGSYFYSVPSGTSTVCSGAVSITQLYQVFTNIAADLTNARLIPNSTF